ncbi:MAG: hypothetical protein OCD01_07090 [Fibrobacterales bacterium]
MIEHSYTVAFKELGDEFIAFFEEHRDELKLFIDASNYANNKSLDELLVEFIMHMERPLDQEEYINSMQKYLNDIFNEIRKSHIEGFIQGHQIGDYLDEKMRIHKKMVMRQQLERFNLCKDYVVEGVEQALQNEPSAAV